MNITSTPRVRATLYGEPDDAPAVRLVRYVETVVTSADGRTLHNHPQAGSTSRTEVAALTVGEAAELLRSLVDAIAYVAESVADGPTRVKLAPAAIVFTGVVSPQCLCVWVAADPPPGYTLAAVEVACPLHGRGAVFDACTPTATQAPPIIDPAADPHALADQTAEGAAQ